MDNQIITDNSNAVNNFFQVMDSVKNNEIYWSYVVSFPISNKNSDTIISYIMFSKKFLPGLKDLAKDGEKTFLEKYIELFQNKDKEFSIMKLELSKSQLKAISEIFIKKYLSIVEVYKNNVIHLEADGEIQRIFLYYNDKIFNCKEGSYFEKLASEKPKYTSAKLKENISAIPYSEWIKLYNAGKLKDVFDKYQDIIVGEPEIERAEDYLKRVRK